MKPRKFKLLSGKFYDIIVGYKSRAYLDTGYIFTPYLPLMETPITTPPLNEGPGYYFRFNDGQPFLLSSGTEPFNITLLANNNANISFSDDVNTFMLYYNV